MSLSATELAADLTEIEADLPSSCVITQGKRRQSVALCTLGDIQAGQTATEEGVFGEDTTPVTIRTALLSWVPTPGALIEAASRKLRVMRVRYVDGDIAMTFECENETK